MAITIELREHSWGYGLGPDLPGYANFNITDGIDVYWHAKNDIPTGLDEAGFLANLNARSAALWIEAQATGQQLTIDETDAFLSKEAIQQQQADDAIAAINTSIAALQPLVFNALSNADKTELIRSALVQILQTQRKIIKFVRWL